MQKLTPQEAAEYMRMSLRTFNRQVAPGVQRIRIGRKVFYQTEDLDAFATECSVPAVKETGPQQRARRRPRRMSREASEFFRVARLLPPLNVRGAEPETAPVPEPEPAVLDLDPLEKCYFAEAAALGMVKIGAAINPLQRLDGLQTACPVALELIAVLGGGYQTEVALHARFAHLRVRGEWFKFTDELRSALAELQREFPVAA